MASSQAKPTSPAKRGGGAGRGGRGGASSSLTTSTPAKGRGRPPKSTKQEKKVDLDTTQEDEDEEDEEGGAAAGSSADESESDKYRSRKKGSGKKSGASSGDGARPNTRTRGGTKVRKSLHVTGHQEKAAPLMTDSDEDLADDLTTTSGLATNSIFFCFNFYKKALICLESKSMTPRRGNTVLFCSSQQLPRLSVKPLKCFLS